MGKLAPRLQNAFIEFLAGPVSQIPIPPSDSPLWSELHAAAEHIGDLTESIEHACPYAILRDSPSDVADRQLAIAHMETAVESRVSILKEAQRQVDLIVMSLYGLDGDEVSQELLSDIYVKPMEIPGIREQVAYETRDYICDLVEDQFAAQRSGQERPLAPAEIAAALAANLKFEPLRAVYYGGKPVSSEQFVRECMDWDCRPIPFDQESVLVGRKPKRVDVLHERFFRFDSVNRNLYGWTGWSAEAQASVFLDMAARAPNRDPYYRWVARLIDLPEESPDISDPDVREGLREIIGDAKPWPYVVMEE